MHTPHTLCHARALTRRRRARAQADDDFVVSDDDDGTGAGKAKGKATRAPAPFVDAVIAELSSKRKLTVGKFNGHATIGIREARAARRRARRFARACACHAAARLARSRAVAPPQFYERDGQTLPGAKGISLTAEQWKILMEAAPAVDAALAALPK